MTKKKHTRDPKKDLQDALKKMPPKVAQKVREGVRKFKPELLHGHHE